MLRNLEIDRLRAIAVLMTIFSHFNGITRGEVSWYGIITQYIQGNDGVILFFSISGYVISLTLIPKINSCLSYAHYKRTLLSFWIKRLTRITPMAILWIAIPFLCTIFLNKSGIWGVFYYNLRGAIAAAFNVFNIFNVFDSGKSIYGVYWSLSLEEQFYIVFPFFLFLFKTYNQRIISLIIAMLLFDLVPNSIRPGFRFEAIAFGVILYLIINRYSVFRDFKVNKLFGIPLATLLIMLILIFPPYVSGLFPASIYEPLDSLVPMLLVWLATMQKGLILPIKSLEPVLDWIGTRSYGLYLIHLPAFYLSFTILYQTQHNNVLCRSFLALIIGVTLAELCYRYFETPIRNYGRNLSFTISQQGTTHDIFLGETAI